MKMTGGAAAIAAQLEAMGLGKAGSGPPSSRPSTSSTSSTSLGKKQKTVNGNIPKYDIPYVEGEVTFDISSLSLIHI